MIQFNQMKAQSEMKGSQASNFHRSHNKLANQMVTVEVAVDINL